MSKENSYLNFLKTFMTDDIYLVPEEEIHQLAEEKTDFGNSDEPIVEPLKIQGRQDSEIAIVVDEIFSEETENRFNTMIEKLGLSIRELAFINLHGQKISEDTLNQITEFPAKKLIFFDPKKSIISDKLPPEFESSPIQKKEVLSLPSFQSITRDKNLVLKCWDSLKKFTANQTND